MTINRPKRPGDLVPYLEPGPSADLDVIQGVVTAFDPANNTNTVELAGGRTETNLPIIGNPGFLEVGSVVMVLRKRTRYFILGPITAVAGGVLGWRHIASGSLAGQSEVSIPVRPIGLYSQLRLTLVGTRGSGAGAGEIWCRINNITSSVYQTGRVNINPISGNMTNNYYDTHGEGFVLAFWTSTAGTNTYGTATGLFLATDATSAEINFEGQFSRQGTTPNVGFTGGRMIGNRSVGSLQIRTEGGVDFADNSRYWLEGYIG